MEDDGNHQDTKLSDFHYISPILLKTYFKLTELPALARDGLAACFGGAAKAVAITKANTIRNFIFEDFYF